MHLFNQPIMKDQLYIHIILYSTHPSVQWRRWLSAPLYFSCYFFSFIEVLSTNNIERYLECTLEIWCMRTLWNDSSHLVSFSITSHIYLFFLWGQHLRSTLLTNFTYTIQCYQLEESLGCTLDPQTLFTWQLKVCTLLPTSPYFFHLPAPGNHFSILFF